jgi:hypothetical protein
MLNIFKRVTNRRLKMEEFLNGETAVMIATFLAGVFVTALTWGATALVKSFKASSNKLDDALIPVLEAIARIEEQVKK